MFQADAPAQKSGLINEQQREELRLGVGTAMLRLTHLKRAALRDREPGAAVEQLDRC